MSVTQQDIRIQQTLSVALLGEDAAWPKEWADDAIKAAVVEQAIYHGLAGLLTEQAGKLAQWPPEVLAALREQALATAMWEMRHRLVIADVLAALADQGIFGIVLKGTALAYDLYKNPATRSRGDSDILVERGNLEQVRDILRSQGFRKYLDDSGHSHEMDLQEMWRFVSNDGSQHDIDLHWQTMNAPALEGVLRFADCAANPLKLPRLCEAAVTMDHATMLIHSCVHRAKHITSPYFSGSVTYYGGDRLIWAQDIHLLAHALSDAEWASFTALAESQLVSAVCLDGLQFAQSRLGTVIPGHVLDRLGSSPQASAATDYLLHSGQFDRAWRDLRAVPGLGQKLSYLLARALPSAEFMRAKYPKMRGRPLPMLYLRRFIELARRRPKRSEH